MIPVILFVRGGGFAKRRGLYHRATPLQGLLGLYSPGLEKPDARHRP